LLGIADMFQNSAMFEPTMEWNGNKSSGFIVLSLTTFVSDFNV